MSRFVTYAVYCLGMAGVYCAVVLAHDGQTDVLFTVEGRDAYARDGAACQTASAAENIPVCEQHSNAQADFSGRF